jgi:hypothetical protein
MMTEEVPHGYVPVLQLYSIVQIYMKPSQCSRLQYKHYTTHDEVQKEENDFSNTYISIDEQISIHFGKASIQDERTCILKLEFMEITLSTGREDSPN